MKISLNWAQQYSNVDLLKIGTDKLLEKVGTQLGAIEETETWGERYQGIVVVKVVAVNQHPNADRLYVCVVDDDQKVKGVKRDNQGYVQVVCGAPNVHAGMMAVWIPPGLTVPASLDTEPFRLESREIRGQISHGMLASASELALSDDHSGILEIKPDRENLTVKPGASFAEVFGLNDTVIDIENKMFTHRPDCFGILGVARELAGIQGLRFKSPSWYLEVPKQRYQAASHKISVKNQIPKLVPRFMAQLVEDIEVGPSPAWLQSYLTRVGIKSINNVVDLSNYYMHLTAQPTHAFDYDKLKAVSGATTTLQPRMAKKGEKLTLLGGKTITLSEDDMVIATDKQAVALAGIMGGAETEVDENTRTIVIEVATFDMYAVRRSGMRHGLFTDALTRFNKGQSPLQNDRVLAELVHQLELIGAKPTSARYDLKSSAVSPMDSVMVTPAFINERLGLRLSVGQISSILENVEINVRPFGKKLAVKPPFWRTDIVMPEDVVEEVGRLHGYDKLPVELPHRSIDTPAKNSMFDFKNVLREALSGLGANEVLTYSFIHGDLLKNSGQDNKQAYKLSNALSPELQYLRLSITPSLLDKVRTNLKAGYDQFALFEMGRTHKVGELDDDGIPVEHENLGFVLAMHDKLEGRHKGAPYFAAKHQIQQLFEKLRLEVTFRHLATTDKNPAYDPFDKKRSALIVANASGEEVVLGIVGEYSSQITKALKLPRFASGFELFVEQLLVAQNDSKATYQPLSKYPKVQQDISLKVAAKATYQDLYQAMQNALLEKKPDHSYFTLVPFDIFQKNSVDKHKHVSFRLTIASNDRTLTADEVNKLLDEAAADVHQELGAERI